MAVARLLAIGALLACASCDDDTTTTADLSGVADLRGAADLASSAADAGLPSTCTTATGADACDPATQYCSQTFSGDPVHRGAPWPNGSESCVALPAACAATPTCACVLANGAQPGCTCTTVGAQLLVTCVRP